MFHRKRLFRAIKPQEKIAIKKKSMKIEKIKIQNKNPDV